MAGIRASNGIVYESGVVILTTGTFLNGLLHLGLDHFPGGRIGEGSCMGLSYSLKELGFKMGRLKTGTCARLDGKSINFDKLAVQYSDENITPFSFQTKKIESH